MDMSKLINDPWVKAALVAFLVLVAYKFAGVIFALVVLGGSGAVAYYYVNKAGGPLAAWNKLLAKLNGEEPPK